MCTSYSYYVSEVVRASDEVDGRGESELVVGRSVRSEKLEFVEHQGCVWGPTKCECTPPRTTGKTEKGGPTCANNRRRIKV